MKNLRPLLALCLVLTTLFPLSVRAVEANRKSALASELTDLMQVRKIAAGYLVQCSKLEGSYLDPKRLFSSDPGLFGGVSPQSAYWPEVVELYAKYLAKACQAVSADKYVAFFAREYETRLSEDELKSAVAFFSSPAGRRYNAASTETNLAFQAYMSKQMTEVVSEAFKDVQSEMRTILTKYKKDPR